MIMFLFPSVYCSSLKIQMSTRLPCPSDSTHAKKWAEVLMNKPRLATFTNRVAHKGYALKRGPSCRNLFNWKRRFLLLQYPFLSYFASNDPKGDCLGIIYLPGCKIEKMPHYPGYTNVLKISPMVRRNMKHVSSTEDEDNFYFNFETPQDLAEWGLHLEESAREGQDDDSEACTTTNETVAAPAVTATSPDVAENSSSKPPPSTTVSSPTGLLLRGFGAPQSPTPESPAGSPHVAISGGNVRRRSFFNSLDAVKCKNSDYVHYTHCAICKVSPVYGFLYTCVVCDHYAICASCFRNDDHNVRHHFLVSPEIDGEVFRVIPSLEGNCKVFRTVELVSFEALFRTIGGTMDNISTKPVQKRRLTQFWENAYNHLGSSGVIEPLTEKDLVDICRNPATVSFDEFIFLLRGKVMHGQSTYADACKAFDTLTKMFQVTVGAESNPNSSTRFYPLEVAALHVYFGACSQDGATVGSENVYAILSRLISIATNNDQVSSREVDGICNLKPKSTYTFEEIETVMEQLLTERNSIFSKFPPHHHQVTEAIENALLYDKQEGLGMYTPQTESFHAAYCDVCGTHPILGFRYHCTVCEDYDLCARCFFQEPHAAHVFTKFPGNISVTHSSHEKQSSPRGERAARRVQFN